MFRGECLMFRNIYTVYMDGKQCSKFIFMNVSQISALELKGTGTRGRNEQMNEQILQLRVKPNILKAKPLSFHRALEETVRKRYPLVYNA